MLFGRHWRPSWASPRFLLTLLCSFLLVCALLTLSHRTSQVEVNWDETPSWWPAVLPHNRAANRPPSARLQLRGRPWERERRQDDEVPWSASPLFSSSHTLDIFPVHAQLDAHAPTSEQLLFAFTTTAKRAAEFHTLWRHFLQHGSPCIVVLPPEEAEEREALQETIGSQCHVRVSDRARYEDRVGSVAQEATDEARELATDVRWVIVGDDDTYWLDFRVLQRMLSAYDVKGDHFIGGVTEAEAQWGAFGRQAYGGAGIIISMPLAHKMASRFEECLEFVKGVWTGGDGVLTYCAAMIKGEDHAEVLQEEKGMHQMDVPGDGTGFFQSGIPFVSVHHYIDGWTDFFPKHCGLPSTMHEDRDAIALITDSVSMHGGDNLFSRYIFEDGRALVSLGYTVSLFAEPLSHDDLAKMEYTWAYDGYAMRFPSRDRIPEGEGKTTYYLERTDGRAKTQTFLSCDGQRVELTYDWLDDR